MFWRSQGAKNRIQYVKKHEMTKAFTDGEREGVAGALLYSRHGRPNALAHYMKCQQHCRGMHCAVAETQNSVSSMCLHSVQTWNT